MNFHLFYYGRLSFIYLLLITEIKKTKKKYAEIQLYSIISFIIKIINLYHINKLYE